LFNAKVLFGRNFPITVAARLSDSLGLAAANLAVIEVYFVADQRDLDVGEGIVLEFPNPKIGIQAYHICDFVKLSLLVTSNTTSAATAFL
jgi:hypothetical protein